jgi:membrane protein implicated in regulation of membrane protease activity
MWLCMMLDILLNYIATNSISFWMFLAVTFCITEVIFGFPIAFFIVGVSAAFTALIVAIFSELNSQPILQLSIFLTGIPVSFFLLWKNIRLFLIKTGKSSYANIVKQTGIVIEEKLNKGKIGKIKWSGTIVKAQLSDTSELNKIDVDEKVYILEIKENVFIVDHIPRS